jgi:hypothetical protein
MKDPVFVPNRFEQEGWRGQLARVERWHARALEALRTGDPHADDYLYAFFQAAFHLKDWLANSGTVDRTTLNGLIKGSRPLGLCRDVCHGSKHFAIRSKWTDTDRLALMREYVPPPSEGGEPGERLRLIAVVGKDDSVNYFPIAELMDDCVEAWRDFCRPLA